MDIQCVRGGLYVFVMVGSVAAGVGCGDVGRESGVPDAAMDAAVDAPPDSPAVVPRCDPKKPFGAPTLVPGINSDVRDQGAKLVDERTLYLGSDRAGGKAGLYVATRSSPDSPFGAPVPIKAINDTGAASGPALTGDGLTMYYALATGAQASADLYVTTRPNKDAGFPAGNIVAQVNSASSEDVDPFITEDGAALYFGSARAGSLDQYVSVRRKDGSFDPPVALTSLNTTLPDGHPVLTQNGLSLYWSSTRSAAGTLGGTDIWLATRPSTAATFGTPAHVPELSSKSDESVSWISADGCEVYLQSNRPGGLGSQDIWQAVRPM